MQFTINIDRSSARHQVCSTVLFFSFWHRSLSLHMTAAAAAAALVVLINSQEKGREREGKADTNLLPRLCLKLAFAGTTLFETK